MFGKAKESGDGMSDLETRQDKIAQLEKTCEAIEAAAQEVIAYSQFYDQREKDYIMRVYVSPITKVLRSHTEQLEYLKS